MTAPHWLQGRRAQELVERALGSARDADLVEDLRRRAQGELAGAELAGFLVVCDLLVTGWTVRVEGGGLSIAPPAEERLRDAERRRIRGQLASERERQLASPPVGAFLRRMEAPRRFARGFTSVFALMRDGRELARRLESSGTDAVAPYVQVARPGEQCEHTGLDLGDVWRYFRHTWLTPYRSTPGRGAMFLVRDAAAAHHPVMGIAMIGSAPSQIADRDRWIGWEPEEVLRQCCDAPTPERADWLARTLDAELSAVWTADLLADGLVRPGAGDDLAKVEIDALLAEARQRRMEHVMYGDCAVLRDVPGSDPDDDAAWQIRAESPLFRAKRAELLAKLLCARRVVAGSLGLGAGGALRALAGQEDGRRAIRLAARRWKASLMGVALADLQICGAVSPYREILGGKLIAMLMTSRDALDAYEARYAGSPSVIASSVAGRPVVRDGRLAMLTTIALFGRGSSQYNRLRGGPGAGAAFLEAGYTAGFGSLHLSEDTAEALAAALSRAGGGRKRYSLFGEGVSPRLRKIREGLDLLGLPSEVILRHGARRTVYLAPLAHNTRRFLQGLDSELDLSERPEATEVTDAWRRRWMSPRIVRGEVLLAVRAHTLERPVRHGARVARSLDLLD